LLRVTRLDRLARSTRDLLNVLHEVAQSSAAFKSLHDHWADTTTPHGRLVLTDRLLNGARCLPTPD
jgi:DNA invertase Pin-like site-specific DNA recombinase